MHKRLTDISERKENEIQSKSRKQHLRRMQTIITGKKLNIGPIRWKANGQQTVVRCFNAQTVAWADLYPFALQTSDFHLLAVCSPIFFLLCSCLYNVVKGMFSIHMCNFLPPVRIVDFPA